MATFQSPYSELKEYNGQPVEIIDHITEPCEGYDAETLPVYVVKFPNGNISTAYPEELKDL